MWRKRSSRAVGGSNSSNSNSSSCSCSSKPGMMSEPPLPLPQEKLKPKPKPKPKPNSRSFSSPASTFPIHFSPRFDSAMSPTSILDTKPHPKTPTPKPPKIAPPPLELPSKGLIEALIASDDDDDDDDGDGDGDGDGDDDDDDDDHHRRSFPAPNSPLSHERRRMVLFGSKLKIQIPSPNPNPNPNPSPSPSSPQQSPIEFGFKNRESQLALLSPARRALLRAAAAASAASAKLVVANLPVTDLELSEDYTCVISHGPNPRTTHIFDNCIIQSRSSGNGGGANEGDLPGSGFLSSRHACHKRLEQGGHEVFIYKNRGEKAFCSSECRREEMIFDEASMD